MEKIILKDGRTVTIDRLIAADKEALRAFDAELSAHSRNLFTPHLYDSETLDKVIARNAADEDVVFAAKADGKIIGYCFLWYAKRRVPLLGIGVADNFQGAGLGHRLMQLLIDTGRALGAEGIELTTALHNDNAFALYQKCGFIFLRNVDNLVGDGNIRTERCMFLPFRPDAQPMSEPHEAPV